MSSLPNPPKSPSPGAPPELAERADSRSRPPTQSDAPPSIPARHRKEPVGKRIPSRGSSSGSLLPLATSSAVSGSADDGIDPELVKAFQNGQRVPSEEPERPRPSSAPVEGELKFHEYGLTPGKASTGASDALSTLESVAHNAAAPNSNPTELTPLSHAKVRGAAFASPGSVLWVPKGAAALPSDGKEPKSPADDSGAKGTPGVDYISVPDPDRPVRQGRQFTLLILALKKKVHSKPMNAILQRLVKFPELDVCVLEEEAIMTTKSTLWPRCDCLIAFGSGLYPIRKVEEYAERVQPLLLNDLEAQHWLLDRRDIYSKLQSASIPVPPHIVVVSDRNPRAGEYTWDQLEEREDAIALKGGKVLLQRPFVEKPTDASDHNITIYFSNADGGGCQRLFRKTNDRCSEYVTGNQEIDKTGSRIYEEFIPTGGTDIKVYTVTGAYAHAEGRKAPVVDGKVLRDSEGKELRCPILLNSYEKGIAQQIVQVFKQNVCGFDILRHHDQSFVCDVNGWSFVKQSRSYHDDCSKILRGLIHRYCASRKTQSSLLASQISPIEVAEIVKVGTANVQDSSIPTPKKFLGSEPTKRDPELLCVIAVLRHGERTPKQKMKVKTELLPWIDLYNKYRVGSKFKEIKLKSRLELLAVLATAEGLAESCGASEAEVLALFRDGAAPDNMPKLIKKTKVACRKIVMVLKRYPLQGINRKVQIKPTKFVDVPGSPGEKQVSQVQVILKWGGEVTEQGVEMSKLEGERFRTQLYVNDDSGGLLRLHNTFRHDLKLYSSDEGRVQTTAAAFAKGMLGLEGQLPPILVSLVRKDKMVNEILDDCSLAKEKLEEVKNVLHEHLSREKWGDEIAGMLNPSESMSVNAALARMQSEGITPRENMERLRAAMASLLKNLDRLVTDNKRLIIYDNETIEEMQHRWEKAADDFYDDGDDEFNVSKIPDIFDSVRYDGRHNRIPQLLDDLQIVHHIAKSLADIIIPQEYGMTEQEKYQIASSISARLRAKLLHDLRMAAQKPSANPVAGGERQSHRYNPQGAAFVDVKSPTRNVRSRIYVTSESHMYALMNMLRAGFYDEKVRTVDCIPPDDGADDAASDSSGRSSRTGSGRAKFASPIFRDQPPSPGKDAAASEPAPAAASAPPVPPSPASPASTPSPRSPLSAAPGVPTPAGPRPSSAANGGGKQPEPNAEAEAEAADTAARAANLQTWEDAMLTLDLSSELGYLSQVVLRLFERPDVPVDSPHRFFVEWLMSTGQTVQEPNDDGPATLQPIFRVHSGMPLEIVEQFLAHSADAEEEAKASMRGTSGQPAVLSPNVTRAAMSKAPWK